MHLIIIIINDGGELLATSLTPGNTDDRQPVADLTKNLVGKRLVTGGTFRRHSLNRSLSVVWS